MRLRGSFIVLLLNLVYVMEFIFLLIDGGSAQDIWALILVIVVATAVTWGYYKGKIWAVYGAFIMGIAILLVSVPDGYINPGFFLYWLAGFLGGINSK